MHSLTFEYMFDVFRGVTAVAYSKHGRSVYTGGADGMICRIDASDGSVAGKFRSSSKAISALAVSSGISTVKWLLDLRYDYVCSSVLLILNSVM